MMSGKSAAAFRTISEVATELDVAKHVLRFWEGKFPQIKPMKRGGGRRYYRPEDLELLRGIRHLLHFDGYTIKGVQKILRERGVDFVKASVMGASALAQGTRAKAATDVSPQAGATGKAGATDKAVSGATLEETLQGTVGGIPAAADIGNLQSEDKTEQSAPAGPTGVPQRNAVLKATIAELELCRQLLMSGAPPAKNQPKRTVRKKTA